MKYYAVFISLFVFTLASYSQSTGESGMESSYKNHLQMEPGFRFSENYPYPVSVITTYQRQVLTTKDFSLDFLVGSGIINSYDCHAYFCPDIRTGIMFVYHIKNRHRIYASIINDFSKDVYGKIKAGYSFNFVKKAFLSLSFENYIWQYSQEHYDDYVDENGDYIETYKVTYNNWYWDITLFSVHFGIGLNF